MSDKDKVLNAVKYIERRKTDHNLSSDAIYYFHQIQASLSEILKTLQNDNRDHIKKLCDELVSDGFLEAINWECQESISYKTINNEAPV